MCSFVDVIYFCLNACHPSCVAPSFADDFLSRRLKSGSPPEKLPLCSMHTTLSLVEAALHVIAAKVLEASHGRRNTFENGKQSEFCDPLFFFCAWVRKRPRPAYGAGLLVWAFPFCAAECSKGLDRAAACMSDMLCKRRGYFFLDWAAQQCAVAVLLTPARGSLAS